MMVNGERRLTGDTVAFTSKPEPRDTYHVLVEQRAAIDAEIAKVAAAAVADVDEAIEAQRAKIRIAEQTISRLVETRRMYTGDQHDPRPKI